MAFPTIPPAVMQFITGVLSDMGVPVTNVAIEGFATWLANEQGGDWSAFENNKGNPLGIQTAVNWLGISVSLVETKFQPLRNALLPEAWNTVTGAEAPEGSCCTLATIALTQNPSPGLMVVSTS